MKKLMVIAVLFVFMTGSAYAAADWNFYGSARISTFYSDWDGDIFKSGEGNPVLGTGVNTHNYEQDFNGNARIGANVKASDELTGRFEFGAKEDSSNDDRASVRILWGEWNFGAGSLGIGKHYTPLLFPYSNQTYNIYAKKDGDTNMALFGMLYGKRKAMIRLKFGNFQIAAVQPSTIVHRDFLCSGNNADYTTATTTAYGTVLATGGTGSEALAAYKVAAATYVMPRTGVYAKQPDAHVEMPSIQLKYKYDFNMGHVSFAGGYQYFDVDFQSEKYKVESYVLAVGARLNVGKAYFKGSVWGGQNVGNLADILVDGRIASTSTDGLKDVDGAGLGFAKFSDGSTNTVTGGDSGSQKGVYDNDALAALLVAGFEIRKGLYVEGGVGYTKTELDETGADENEGKTWYLQSTVFLAPGVFLTPEVGGFDGVEDGDMEIFYAGIKWQINF